MVELEAKVIELTAEASSLNAECKLLEQRMYKILICKKTNAPADVLHRLRRRLGLDSIVRTLSYFIVV